MCMSHMPHCALPLRYLVDSHLVSLQLNINVQAREMKVINEDDLIGVSFRYLVDSSCDETQLYLMSLQS